MERMETKNLWLLRGDFLHESAVQRLARYVSGYEIPAHIMEKNTFNPPTNTSRDTDAAVIVGAEIRELRHHEVDRAHGSRVDIWEGLIECAEHFC